MDAVFNVPVDIGAAEDSQAQVDAGGVRGSSGLLMFCVLQSEVGRFKGTPNIIAKRKRGAVRRGTIFQSRAGHLPPGITTIR